MLGIHRYGPTAGPTVVLLHSSQSNSGQWRGLIQSLAVKVQIIAVDLLGYGQAPSHEVASSTFRFSHEIDRIIAAINSYAAGQPIHLVGHSYGGALALKLAVEQPFPVASLAVFEPVAFHLLPSDSAAAAEIKAVADNMESWSAAQATEQFVDYWNDTGYFQALPEKIQRIMVAQADKVNADFSALMGESYSLADVARVQCPVLLLSGETSRLSAKTVAQLLQQALPQATALALPVGHMGPVTAPQVVNPLLVDFLSAQLPAPVSSA